MKLKDIKFNGSRFNAQWLVDLHNVETGDNKSLAECPYADEITLSDDCTNPYYGYIDKTCLFRFAEWLDMGLYLDLMRLAVDSLGWDNVK